MVNNDETKLKFFNGYGGFDELNNKYVIKIRKKLKTPTPWVNVISNPKIGFVTSESGGADIHGTKK